MHTFNGPLSGTTQVSRYQKCKSVCTSLQTDNHASTPPLSVLQARCPSCRPTNSIKAVGWAANKNILINNITVQKVNIPGISQKLICIIFERYTCLTMNGHLALGNLQMTDQMCFSCICHKMRQTNCCDATIGSGQHDQ